MSVLPDELWRRILEIGVQSSSSGGDCCIGGSGIGIVGLTYKDLCSLSISCRRFHRLSDEDSVWNCLLHSDFTSNLDSSSSLLPSSKTLYKLKFERERERKLAAQRRVVLRKESQIAEHSRKIREIETRLTEESFKMNEALTELSNLHKVRQASVALNVWQPEVIRGRQKQIVQQHSVPAESRIQAVEMEVKLCKQQLKAFEKSYNEEKQRLDKAKEELASIKYHPLRDYKRPNTSESNYNLKQKKLRKCNIFEGFQTKVTYDN